MCAGHKFLRGFTISEAAWAAWSSATILDVLNVLFNGGDVREEERDRDQRKNTSRDWDFSASQTMNVCIRFPYLFLHSVLSTVWGCRSKYALKNKIRFCFPVAFVKIPYLDDLFECKC